MPPGVSSELSRSAAIGCANIEPLRSQTNARCVQQNHFNRRNSRHQRTPKKYVPLEFRAIRPPSRLITGNDLKKSDRSDADNFEGEIFNAPSGWFRIRVKAVGFEPDDFKLSIDFSEFVLGVDATHEQQTRDGLSVQRRITRRYQMASEVDLCSLRAFLTSDGHFLEITGEKAQNEAQRQKNWGSNELKKTQQKERHFDRWTVPYSAKTKIELGRAENEMGEQRALRRKNIIDD